jgi:hypothetical protein
VPRRGKKIDSKNCCKFLTSAEPFIKLRTLLPERFLSPAVSCVSILEETQMALNTTSFLAGVGSMVAVLSTGLAGGYFLANPSHIDAPNRLQRVAAANRDSEPAQVTTAAKPEVVAPAAPTTAPAPATEQAAQPAVQAAAPAAQPVVALPETKASEPSPPAVIHETAAPTVKPDTDAKANVEQAHADKARAAESRSADARTVEKKRVETRKIAEQQRKQRELEVATIAVRRIIHGRDGSDVADSDQTDAPVADRPVADRPAAEMPHFNLFGQ